MPSKIEWTQETYNPITGCTPISPGCRNCYAKRMARRLAGRHGYPEAPHHFDVTFHPDRLDKPLHWKKPRTVFVCSMSDLFHKDVDDQWRLDIFSIIYDCPGHTFQILTKRISEMKEFISYMEYHVLGESFPDAFPNVWLGVTAENQEQADKRIPVLLQIPAAVRFVSIEPCLGDVDPSKWLPCRRCSNNGIIGYSSDTVEDCPDCNAASYYQSLEGGFIDWIIVGAETGPGARPMDLDWARSVRDVCADADVAFFFKKDSDGNRELDGRLWGEMPNAQS
jgi:protein gp37